MTRVPSVEASCPEVTTVAGRLAEFLRTRLLTAAQVGLRAVREALARLPKERSADGLAPTAAAPAAADRSATPAASATEAAAAPAAVDALRTFTPLPDSYGSERVVLLARDPHCLFAYWDVSEARRKRVRHDAASDNLRAVLRAYDVTQVPFDAAPPNRFQDFPVHGDARSVYAYVGKPAACFVAEIGYLRPDGAFFPLARSQPIWTPRTEQPGSAPGRWMTVGWTERRDAGALVPVDVARTPYRAGAPAGDTAETARQAPSSWPGPAPSSAQRGSWSLVRGGRGNAASTDDSQAPEA